jgi:hypothetical protein
MQRANVRDCPTTHCLPTQKLLGFRVLNVVNPWCGPIYKAVVGTEASGSVWELPGASGSVWELPGAPGSVQVSDPQPEVAL